MKLKVCGLTQLHQIEELIAMNVDFLGFIFYEKSQRYVLKHLNLEDISQIHHSGKTGVFVNENAETVIELAEKAGLHFIQLHGDEDENFIATLRKELNPDIGIIKVIRMGEKTENIESQIQNLKTNISYLLFDTDAKTFGGTGKTFDWTLLNNIKIPCPYFLSGGISLENSNHLNTLRQTPFSLDINSKFETEPGIKDVEKIKRLYEKL